MAILEKISLGRIDKVLIKVDKYKIKKAKFFMFLQVTDEFISVD